jgi:hypothetical protein
VSGGAVGSGVGVVIIHVGIPVGIGGSVGKTKAPIVGVGDGTAIADPSVGGFGVAFGAGVGVGLSVGFGLGVGGGVATTGAVIVTVPAARAAVLLSFATALMTTACRPAGNVPDHLNVTPLPQDPPGTRAIS